MRLIPILFLLLFTILLSGCASASNEPPEGFVRIFNWGGIRNEEAARRYALAGVTDILVFSKRQFNLARKYNMNAYYGCFKPVGPHMQVMTKEEESAHSYINGFDLPKNMPLKKRNELLNQRRKEKDCRFGGETPHRLDTINVRSLFCFISDQDLKLSKARMDTILAKVPEGAAGIYFDYFGYTNHRGCYCKNCLLLYRNYLRQHKLKDNAHSRGLFYRDELVKYYNSMVSYVKSKRPSFKVVAHFYPDFPFERFFGNRTKVDVAGQTVAWYFKAPLEKVASDTRKILAEEKRFQANTAAVPFIGLNTNPKSALGYKTPQEVEKELRTILASGGRTLMICNGEAMIAPGYFEVFCKYNPRRKAER